MTVSPDWDAAGLVPFCTESCDEYDGKRCRLLGIRPGSICEPAVVALTEQRNELSQRVTELEAHPLKVVTLPAVDASKRKALLEALERLGSKHSVCLGPFQRSADDHQGAELDAATRLYRAAQRELAELRHATVRTPATMGSLLHALIVTWADETIGEDLLEKPDNKALDELARSIARLEVHGAHLRGEL